MTLLEPGQHVAQPLSNKLSKFGGLARLGRIGRLDKVEGHLLQPSSNYIDVSDTGLDFHNQVRDGARLRRIGAKHTGDALLESHVAVVAHPESGFRFHSCLTASIAKPVDQTLPTTRDDIVRVAVSSPRPRLLRARSGCPTILCTGRHRDIRHSSSPKRR